MLRYRRWTPHAIRDVDGYWWVVIENAWYRVPPEAVVMDAGNPFDEPVVWYLDYGANWTQRSDNPRYHIRCFVPASEGWP